MVALAKVRKSSTKAAKIVHVICRVQFKSDPNKVAYKVRSSDGSTTYWTYLFEGKATNCECPASKPCYHMTQLEQKEAERTTRKKAEQEIAEAQAQFPYGGEVQVPAYAGTTGVVVSDVYMHPLDQILCCMVNVDGTDQCFSIYELQDAEKRAAMLQEAADRAAYCSMFGIYD